MGNIKNNIIFTDTLGVSEKYAPVPASKMIPEWYRELDSYIGNIKKPVKETSLTNATAKRCMPIFDSITGGYLILTHTDIFIEEEINEIGEVVPYFHWASHEAINFHPKNQLPYHPDGEHHKFSYPKWVNTWSIKTPPGYSTLFIPPLHRETPIVILPGIVDTDKYDVPVNFPFVLKNINMRGIIPAGTPIAQVIPIKRDSWEMKMGKNEDLMNVVKTRTTLRSLFFDSYKKQFRQTKEYK